MKRTQVTRGPLQNDIAPMIASRCECEPFKLDVTIKPPETVAGLRREINYKYLEKPLLEASIRNLEIWMPHQRAPICLEDDWEPIREPIEGVGFDLSRLAKKPALQLTKCSTLCPRDAFTSSSKYLRL
ncbi:hypothetical protein FRB99_007929, partial [Tulasnella sp. 403]